MLCVQEVVRRWATISLEQQQVLFQVALVTAGEGAWQPLGARLQAALDWEASQEAA